MLKEIEMNANIKILLSICLWINSVTNVAGTVVQYHLVFSRTIQNVDNFKKHHSCKWTISWAILTC